MDVQGKAALVMGGGSGIGRAVALTLASHGASVAIGDLVAERAEQVAGEIKEIGQQSLGSSVDVTRQEQVRELVDKTLDAFGRIDILVNSAGIFPQATIQDMGLPTRNGRIARLSWSREHPLRRRRRSRASVWAGRWRRAIMI